MHCVQVFYEKPGPGSPFPPAAVTFSALVERFHRRPKLRGLASWLPLAWAVAYCSAVVSEAFGEQVVPGTDEWEAGAGWLS